MTTSSPSTPIPDSVSDTRIDLSSPAHLIAAVPYLLGFRPVDSVVVVAHAADTSHASRSGTISHVMRMDIPPAEAVAELEPVLRPPLSGAAAVTLVVVGGTAPPDGGPAHRDVVSALAAVMTALGVPIAHALWTPAIEVGSPWCCYGADRCGGVVPDPSASTMAAATAHAGHVTYSSREAMERSLDPDDDGALARRAALLELAVSRRETGFDDGAESIVGALAVVRDALRRFRSGLDGRDTDAESSTGAEGRGGSAVLTDQEIADLAMALSRHEVRDACLGLAWPAGEPRALAAERLWSALVRATPEPERAEPAALLAYSAYLRGDGALAGMAVRKAKDADPGHLFAKLLDQVLARGMPPERLAGLAQAYGAPALFDPHSDGDMEDGG